MGDGVERARGWRELGETVGQADNRTIAPAILSSCGYQYQNCIRTDSVNMDGGGVHELSPLAEELLTADVYWRTASSLCLRKWFMVG